MHLVPGMHETVLGQVLGKFGIPRQLAQEVSHLRLVALDQLAECPRVLMCDNTRDQVTIDILWIRVRHENSGQASRLPNLNITKYAIPISRGNIPIAARARVASGSPRMNPNNIVATPTDVQMSPRRKS